MKSSKRRVSVRKVGRAAAALPLAAGATAAAIVSADVALDATPAGACSTLYTSFENSSPGIHSGGVGATNGASCYYNVGVIPTSGFDIHCNGWYWTGSDWKHGSSVNVSCPYAQLTVVLTSVNPQTWVTADDDYFPTVTAFQLIK
jgi:hypothetical protein